MKNRFYKWYARHHDKNDIKYRKKHGDEKFLIHASRDFLLLMICVILIFLACLALLFAGILFLLSPSHMVFFIFGILFVLLSSFMFLSLILMIFLISYHKQRSRKAKNELQLLLKEKELAPEEEVSELEVDNSEGMQDVVENTKKEMETEELEVKSDNKD